MVINKVKFSHLRPKEITSGTAAEEFVAKAALRTENIYLPTDKRDQTFLLRFNYYEMQRLEEGFQNSRCRSKQEYIRSLIFKE